MYEDSYQELEHHGVKGQKWGVRRYQNEDGSLTDTGKKHLKRAKRASIKEFKRLGRIAKNSASGYTYLKEDLNYTRGVKQNQALNKILNAKTKEERKRYTFELEKLINDTSEDDAKLEKQGAEMRRRSEDAYEWLSKMRKTFGETVLDDIRDGEVISYAEAAVLSHNELMKEKMSRLK